MGSPKPDRQARPHDAFSGHPIVERFRAVLIALVAIAAVILVMAALRAGAIVFAPFVAALFVALAVAPVDAAVTRWMPRRLEWIGHAAAMTVVLLILLTFFAGVVLAARQAAGAMPGVVDQLGAALPGGETAGSAAATSNAEAAQGGRAAVDPASPDASDVLLGFDVASLFDRFVAYLADNAAAFSQAILGALATFLSGLVLVFFLVLLMLVEGSTWRDKAALAFSPASAERWETTLAVLARRFRWFLLVRAMLGAITATLYVSWLFVFDVDLLIVWWMLAFLLNFIPTLGSIVAGTLPVIYAFVTKDLTTAAFVAAGLLLIEQVMGNYVDPRVQGKQLSISPLVTFFALLLFGWMWGIVGALLAVPIAVFAVIALAHVPGLRGVALLLSDSRTGEELVEMTTL